MSGTDDGCQETSAAAAELSVENAVALVASGGVLKNCVHLFDKVLQERNLDGINFKVKSDGSLVSDLEGTIETAVGAYLKETTPWASFCSEEGLTFSASAGRGPFKWFLDPIDGTISFRNGLPFFAFTLTLAHEDEPIAAVIHLPKLFKTYTALRGKGAYCNERKLDLRSRPAPDKHSVLAHSDAYTFELVSRTSVLDALRKQPYILRSYTDAFGYCLVAEGACVAKFDAAGALWDIWPGYLIIKEAYGACVLYKVPNPTPDLYASVLVGQTTIVRELAQQLTAAQVLPAVT